MRYLAYFAVLLSGTLPALSAAAQTPARHARLLDLTGATGKDGHYISLAGWQLWGLDTQGRFQAGLGIRATEFFGAQATYGPQDTETPVLTALPVVQPRLLALNAALHLRARVAGPVGVGFTIDLAGVTLGPARDLGPLPATAPDVRGPAAPRPMRGNLLRGGVADYGSLNSEFYVSIRATPRFSFRGGASHAVTSYVFAGDRYNRFVTIGLLGVTYAF